MIFTDAAGADLLVSLRVFGMANDWFAAAAEAMAIGLRDILPWQRRFGRDVPMISDRKFHVQSGLPLPQCQDRISLKFITPVDVSGQGRPDAHSILSRLLRRVDGLARWQGLALDPDYGRALAGQFRQLDLGPSRLTSGQYHRPNRMGQARRYETLTGVLTATGPLAPLLPIFATGARCHIGRAANEGLGRYETVRLPGAP